MRTITKDDIETAWRSGYYHAGYTNDSAYADQEAEKFSADYESPAQPDTAMFNAMLMEASRIDGAMPAQPDTAASDMCMLTDDLGCTVRKAQTTEIARLNEQLAAQAGQQLEGDTSGYITTVPDKSDRIVWRNHYYHLPIKTVPAQAGQECHICHQPKNMSGSDYCSYPHPAAQAPGENDA